MRVRCSNVPSADTRIALEVLISYRSSELKRAQAFAARLSRLGFTTRLLLAEGPAPSTELTIEKLSQLVRQTDRCCVLVSAEAAQSHWVRFEYQESAELHGRVIFIPDFASGGQVTFDERSIYAAPSSCSMIVKHTMVVDNAPDEVLLREICNDPDEGWFDGSEQYEIAASRNLKAESEIRKFVRGRLRYDPRYAHKTIVDVIPFSWDDSPTRDRDEIFRWVLDSRGRGDLRRALGRGEVDGFLAPYFATSEPRVMSFLGQED